MYHPQSIKSLNINYINIITEQCCRQVIHQRLYDLVT